MEHDGSSRVLTLRRLTSDVESRHGPFPIPDLADFQGKELADPQAGADAESNKRPVTKSIASVQVGQGEFEFFRS